MSKAVLISIQPRWCELIASGKKTIEVRKTKPKLETPFKCYIYQTLPKQGSTAKWGGRVIGEFVCDDIRWISIPYPAFQGRMDEKILEQSCCTYYQLHRYVYGDPLATWHVSDLIIYDRPKALSEFIRVCPEWEKEEFTAKCHKCEHYIKDYEDCFTYCDVEGELPITRPPQSWCYVEEVQDDA